MGRILKQLGLRRQRNRRIVQFILLAILGDFGLICIELAMGLNPITDMAQRPFLYIYVFSGTIAAFGVFGAMVGSREDLLEEMALRDSLTGLFNSRYLQMRMKEALEAAIERADFSVMEKLLIILSQPYHDLPEQTDYYLPPPPSAQPYRTFCGT